MTGRAAEPGVLHTWWRSSLRVRVITTTMVLGTVLAVLIGSVVFGQVAQGLVQQAVDAATVDAAQQARRVQEQFEAIDQRDNSSLNTAAFETVNLIAPAEQETRGVVLARSLSNDRDPLISTYASSDIGIDEVPEALRQALDADGDNQQIMVTDVTFDEVGTVPSVLVGSRVTIPRAGPHDLVLVYPMQREQNTLDLVRQWFLFGGLGLMVLIGAMAWLATRMVTHPVGRAVQVSQQLARGELGQRLPVTGSGDELDRLATSFNTMADSLQSQIHQLETLSRLQQRFVSDVSHELRTPLTTIRMAGEVLHASRSEFSTPVARSAELLHEELDRFEDLLTELLEISRYDSGAADLEVERVDLCALVSSVLEALAGLVRHSGSRVRVESSAPSVEVEVDPRRVSRILRNLIGNALEHGEGRPVEITVTASEEVVAVSVRDHGVGFPPEQADQVFERFWRADTARTRTTGGTGLGLAISLEDARLHGGWLQATGAPGQGALFRLTLPRERGVTISQAPPRPVLERTPAEPPVATIEDRDDQAAQGGRSLAPSPSLRQEPS